MNLLDEPFDGLTYQDVLAILKVVRQSSRFDTAEVVVDGMSVYVAARERSSLPAPARSAEAIERVTSILTAPVLGTLRWACEGRSPGAQVGAILSRQAAVGRIDTLGQTIDVISGQDGVVIEVLAGHGTFVEYGQPLLRIEHT